MIVSTSSAPIYHEAAASTVDREWEERPEGGERGSGEAEIMERGARDVPRRALNTASSGLGMSKANPRRDASSGAGGSRMSCLLERLDISDPLRTESRWDELLREWLDDFKLWLGCFLSASPMGIRVPTSSTRTAAKVEGAARACRTCGENSGESGVAGDTSAGSGSRSALRLAALLFIASLDGLASFVLLRCDNASGILPTGGIEGGRAERSRDMRLPSV